MILQKLVNKITPRQLFLLDSIGALLTATMLGFVLPMFQEYFGMPVDTLHTLSIIAVCFFLYSLLCYISNPQQWKPFLKIIATANALYCCLTTTLVIYYHAQLTTLGWIYFIQEILIIVSLVYIELSKANKSHQ